MDTIVWILRSIKQKTESMFLLNANIVIVCMELQIWIIPLHFSNIPYSWAFYICCTMCLVIFSFLQVNNKEEGKFLGSYFTFQKFFYWHCSSLARATEIIICTRVCKKFNSTDKLYALQMIYCFIGNRSRHRVVINRFWMNKKR